MIILDEVITGALVNAIAMVGRRIRVSAADLRKADDLTTARWFETFRLTGTGPAHPELSPKTRDHLADILNGDEIQAALQQLLAVRLTDAPETDASRARDVIRLKLSMADPDAARFAEALTAYYDNQICDLVARLEGEDPPLLAQIRSEAFHTRMVNILLAIEHQTAALAKRPDHRTEVGFLTSYRGHVIDQHGKLEPPDFERRRRVPIADIYVPTMITADPSSGRTVTRQPTGSALDVFALAERIERSVLLGDPGGGKTTAANVLMHHFVSETARVPFLVTLRDFAAQDPPERSVIRYIEHTLETLYQCPSPPGLVNLLLLTARAVVVFDGLDELLDTSRRADVTTRVERFCVEYPLVPVLVTSRLVGYNQARLDDRQFSCYRLGGFDDKQVAEYARKWFAQDTGAIPGDAEEFLSASDSVPDLRSNPLLFALLCILYRGAGSLPRNRAEVYEQCATLLFRKWDARRRIHQDLRAGHLLEPVLRYLAWWLFNREDAKPVTERILIAVTTEFLHGRGFESEHDALGAAREFVEFCRGRMWVFSDAGTTATGEKLYAFTHRTFLEYFAAAQLAYECDSPELLSENLAPHVARNEWWVLAELAVQLKDRTSNDGALRIYAAMLSDLSPNPAKERANKLRFLAQCLRSVDPSPRYVRELTRQILQHVFVWRDLTQVEGLLADCGTYRDIVADEIDVVVADMLRCTEGPILLDWVKFTVSLPAAFACFEKDNKQLDRAFWESRVDRLIVTHSVSVVLAAQADRYVRSIALQKKLITTKQALEMRGVLTAFFLVPRSFFREFSMPPYLAAVYERLLEGWPKFSDPSSIADLEAIGEYLCDHARPPWLSGRSEPFPKTGDAKHSAIQVESSKLRPVAYLGAAAILAILVEDGEVAILEQNFQQLGPLGPLFPYLACRRAAGLDTGLPELPVPDKFKQTFRDWAEGRINLTA